MRIFGLEKLYVQETNATLFVLPKSGIKFVILNVPPSIFQFQMIFGILGFKSLLFYINNNAQYSSSFIILHINVNEALHNVVLSKSNQMTVFKTVHAETKNCRSDVRHLPDPIFLTHFY